MEERCCWHAMVVGSIPSTRAKTPKEDFSSPLFSLKKTSTLVEEKYLDLDE